MQNFRKTWWIASWRTFNGFVQLRSVLESFPCCTIMRPPTKLLVSANFWPQKSYKLLSPPPPVISRFISARLFSVPQVENECKRAPLCGCCWDRRSRNWWIKEGPKRGIFGSFLETVRPRKSLYTGCNRRKGQNFGRVFLMLKYADITQNTYIQSWTVTEIMAREKCCLLAGPRTVPVSCQVVSMFVLESGVLLLMSAHTSL